MVVSRAMDSSRNRSTRPIAAEDSQRKAGASELILLNPAESVEFIKALNADLPPPTPRMARALELYRETVSDR